MSTENVFNQRSRVRRIRTRRGQSLVEFALVALAVYLLLAAILTFGHALHGAQTVQGVADSLARELSRTPLDADSTLQDALDDEDVRRNVFDERYLVLAIPQESSGQSLRDLIDSLPVINQQMVPLMISDEIDGQRVLRYPGAILANDDSVQALEGMPSYSGYHVEIPLIEEGNDTVQLIPVVEELAPDVEPGQDAREASPFNILSKHRGVVALRVNYPFQSASMSSFHPNPQGPFEATIGSPIEADDSPPGGTTFGPHAGELGLGVQAAFGKTVRPYRRLISGQAVYRREILGK